MTNTEDRVTIDKCHLNQLLIMGDGYMDMIRDIIPNLRERVGDDVFQSTIDAQNLALITARQAIKESPNE